MQHHQLHRSACTYPSGDGDEVQGLHVLITATYRPLLRWWVSEIWHNTVIPQTFVNDISVFFFFFIVFNFRFFGRPQKFVNNVQFIMMYPEMFKVFIFVFPPPPTKINEQ